jgi:hypothetical protein
MRDCLNGISRTSAVLVIRTLPVSVCRFAQKLTDDPSMPKGYVLRRTGARVRTDGWPREWTAEDVIIE